MILLTTDNRLYILLDNQMACFSLFYIPETYMIRTNTCRHSGASMRTNTLPRLPDAIILSRDIYLHIYPHIYISSYMYIYTYTYMSLRLFSERSVHSITTEYYNINIAATGFVCLLFYIPATLKAISGRIPTCACTHGVFIVLPDWEIRPPAS